VSKQSNTRRSIILKQDPPPILAPMRLIGPITQKRTPWGKLYEYVKARHAAKKEEEKNADQRSENGS